MLFIEETSPPPFYQEKLTPARRTQLDKWFIGKRSQDYYLRRFAQFDEQGYLSPKWNWAAFFVTFGWLLYRKRYLDTIVYTVAGWSFIQLNIVIILSLVEFALIPFVAIDYQMAVRILIAAIIWIFWAVMVARWSDAYYYRMARREIADVLEMYPQQPDQQKAHLKREGGVSPIGLGLAFAIFGFSLLVIQMQFLPLYSKPKARGYIDDAYVETLIATQQIEANYEQQGACPVDMRFDLNTQIIDIDVTTESAALVNKQSPCVVTSTMQNIPFPNRNLNGQRFILYRPADKKDNRWRCMTSLNEKLTPNNCRSEP